MLGFHFHVATIIRNLPFFPQPPRLLKRHDLHFGLSAEKYPHRASQTRFTFLCHQRTTIAAVVYLLRLLLRTAEPSPTALSTETGPCVPESQLNRDLPLIRDQTTVRARPSELLLVLGQSADSDCPVRSPPRLSVSFGPLCSDHQAPSNHPPGQPTVSAAGVFIPVPTRAIVKGSLF